MKKLSYLLTMLSILTAAAHADGNHRYFTCGYDNSKVYFTCIDYTQTNSSSVTSPGLITDYSNPSDLPDYPYCLCLEGRNDAKNTGKSRCDYIDHPLGGKTPPYSSYKAVKECKTNSTPVCGNFALMLSDLSCKGSDSS